VISVSLHRFISKAKFKSKTKRDRQLQELEFKRLLRKVKGDFEMTLGCMSPVNVGFDKRPGTISPTFYKQFIRAQISKEQRASHVISVFLNFWDL